jgi:hypothetical protein
VCDSPNHAAQYHILGLEVEGFISDPALGWLQSEELGYGLFNDAASDTVVSNVTISEWEGMWKEVVVA